MDKTNTSIAEQMNAQIDRSKWCKYKVSDFVKNIVEKIVPKDSDLTHYIGLEHLDSGSLHIKRFGDPSTLSGDKLKIYKGDIIFAKRNAYLKRAAVAEFDAIASAHSMVLRANPEVVLPEFLPFFMMSEVFWTKAIEISVGSLSPTINWKTLAKQEFLLPPKDQQAKLAELLWAADESMTCFELLLVKAQSAYVSYIEKALINKAGSYVKATALGEIVRGVGYKPKELLEHKEDGAVVLLRSNNIQNGNLVLDNVHIIPKHLVKEKQLLVPGDHAVCMSNGSKELVGKAARYDSADEDLCVGSFCSVFRPSSSKNANLTSHLFSGETYRRRIKQILTGSNINNLKPDDFDLIGFRMLNDKNALNQVLNHCDVLLASKKQIVAQVDRSKVLLKSLINEIFSQ
jgi:type I restriction enzyme S subunit